MLKFSDIILYEDNDYIIVNKPYDYATLEDRDKTKTYILQMARNYWADAQVCHRLDKETSGILAIAKTPEAYRHLSMQFESREVVKIYHAVVKGMKRFDNQMVDLPILVNKDGNVRIDKSGKEAATIFNSLEIFNKYSLVACFPISGRMHQIRIHLATQGTPIVADKQYGGEDIFLSYIKRNINLKKDTLEQPLIGRIALHARNLTFALINGEQKTFEAPYPKDMETLLKQLAKNAS